METLLLRYLNHFFRFFTIRGDPCDLGGVKFYNNPWTWSKIKKKNLDKTNTKMGGRSLLTNLGFIGSPLGCYALYSAVHSGTGTEYSVTVSHSVTWAVSRVQSAIWLTVSSLECYFVVCSVQCAVCSVQRTLCSECAQHFVIAHWMLCWSVGCMFTMSMQWFVCCVNTLFHTESLNGLVGPHLRLFLVLNMLPLEISVLKGIVLIALLQNKSWNKYLMLRVTGQYPNSGRRYLLLLDGAAHLKYWPFWGSSFSDEVSGKSALF